MQISRRQLQAITGCPLRFGNKPGGSILATARHALEEGDDKQEVEGSKYEWFQIFDQNDSPYTIDGMPVVLYRTECHGPDRIQGVFHRGADVWVVDNDDRLLIPLRSETKDLHPGKGDNSVGEHNKVGEAYLEAAIRGFAEELDTMVSEEELALVVKLPMRERDQWQMSQYYAYRDTDGKIAASTTTLSPEISRLTWLPIESLVGKDLAAEVNFRPDHARALETFVSQYASGACPI